MYYFEDQVAQVCEQFKIRAILGETIIDMPVCDNVEPSGGLTYCETFLPKWKDHPLITPLHWLLMRRIPIPMKGWKRTVELSERFDVPITLHVAEMDYEMQELASSINKPHSSCC